MSEANHSIAVKQSNQNKAIIEAFFDSTYFSEEKLKSVHGFFVYIDGNVVKYRTKKLRK